MSPCVLLTSSGITSPHVQPVLDRLLRGLARGAIVTTAEAKLKERSRPALIAHGLFGELGIPDREFFDFDTRPADELLAFDFVHLITGNPFYLLKRARETGADGALETLLQSGRPCIASGAGALLLGPTLLHMRFFDPAVPHFGGPAAPALGVLPFAVLPHANRWRARFVDYEQRLSRACTAARCQLAELEDDEAFLIENRHVSRIHGELCAAAGG